MSSLLHLAVSLPGQIILAVISPSIVTGALLLLPLVVPPTCLFEPAAAHDSPPPALAVSAELDKSDLVVGGDPKEATFGRLRVKLPLTPGAVSNEETSFIAHTKVIGQLILNEIDRLAAGERRASAR